MAMDDPRTAVGAVVHAKATTAKDNVRAIRNLFGRKYKEGWFEGRITKTFPKRLSRRNYTWIECRWAVAACEKPLAFRSPRSKLDHVPSLAGKFQSAKLNPTTPTVKHVLMNLVKMSRISRNICRGETCPRHQKQALLSMRCSLQLQLVAAILLNSPLLRMPKATGYSGKRGR